MAREFLGELQALFFDTFIGWLRNTVIGKAVQKLISMFNPVGALIQAVITIYNMIQFFLERAKQIAALINATFNSIAEIAAGNLKKAVAAVEDSLVKALPVAIGFLANLVGIGGLAAKIKEIIQKIRKPIDKVVDKVVGFIAGKAKAFIARIRGADKPKEEPPQNQKDHDEQVEAGLAALDGEELKHLENNEISRDNAEKVAVAVKKAYPVFKSISVVDGGETWDYDYVASPGRRKQGEKKKEVINEQNEKSVLFDIEIKIVKNKYSESAQHIEDAQKAGKPSILTIDRPNTDNNRRESLRGIEKVPPKQLDEYPPAMFKEGGKGASIRAISAKDNQGMGAMIGNLLRKYPDGTRVKFTIVN